MGGAGIITSQTSRGANRLIYQGATPIDDDAFDDCLFSTFGCLKSPEPAAAPAEADKPLPPEYETRRQLAAALVAERRTTEQLVALVAQGLPGVVPLPWLMVEIAALQRAGQVSQYSDGRFGPRVSAR